MGDQLKSMTRRGLIEAGRIDGALGFKTIPFVIGLYENQVHSMDAELAHLVEDYFKGGFGKMLSVEPQFHRVIPVHETVHTSVKVRPFESVAEIVYSMRSWGVQDCVCRKQKALIGQVCKHPVDVCLAMDPHPNAFDDAPDFRALTLDEAMVTLRRAAEAGLVHTVTNTVEGTSYICNCCSCGLLRGMAELGIANVVASSPFVNLVQDELCTGCEDCVPACQFNALSMDEALAQIDRDRCVGCGVCAHLRRRRARPRAQASGGSEARPPDSHRLATAAPRRPRIVTLGERASGGHRPHQSVDGLVQATIAHRSREDPGPGPKGHRSPRRESPG